uniref:Uncharacterized protein n=1 Tax=Rhizophora mucronata TaxID=61149 RepID=A0A2P2IT24_RHIMU
MTQVKGDNGIPIKITETQTKIGT